MKLTSLALFSLSTSMLRAHHFPPVVSRRETEQREIQDILNKTFRTLGGIDNWNQIEGMSYTASKIYRSHTLSQNYDIWLSDQTVSSSGSQTRSFNFSNDTLLGRIDRTYQYDDYWLWAFPDLKPAINFSLVIHDGPQGFACFNQGQNSFFADDPSKALGYTDSYLTNYLIHQTHQFALPWLLKTFAAEPDQLHLHREHDNQSRTTYDALDHRGLGLTMLIDTESHVPRLVRSMEKHAVFGDSTSDLIFTHWSPIREGTLKIMFPHRLQTVYNSETVLEDFIIDSVILNPALPASHFDANPPPSTDETPRSPSNSHPSRSKEYPRSEVHEMFESGLWAGPFGEVFGTANVTIEHPIPDLPQVRTIYIGYLDYVQLLVEFEDGLLITDAPAHRSKIILEWVKQNMHGKRITHVVPSHHHRDHAGGVKDYVDAGAKLIVPDIAKDFYALTIPDSRIETYTSSHPFILKDPDIEFRSYFNAHAPHAADWAWAAVSKTNATESDGFVVWDADVINPGTDALKWDTGAAWEFLRKIVEAGVPREAVLVGSHGSTEGGTSTTDMLVNVAEQTGFVYPNLTVGDWRRGG